jgi:hypothetical protein
MDLAMSSVEDIDNVDEATISGQQNDDLGNARTGSLQELRSRQFKDRLG